MKRFAAGSLLILLSAATPAFAIGLSYPNGGEALTQGTGCVITWDPSGIAGQVGLEYSDDNGSSWHPIASATANDGAHSWVLPHATSAQYLVRATDIDAAVSDASDAAFGVVGSTLKVLYPNGPDDYLVAGRPGQIRWNSFGDVQAVKIEVTYDGTNWAVLAASTPNDGRHPWTPSPADSTSLARVRITDADADQSPTDTSDAPFPVYVSDGTVTFTVTVPPLPAGEFVSLSRGEFVTRMAQDASNPSRWRLTLGGFGWNETFTYRYCRNGEFGAAREVLTSGYQSAPGDFWREDTATGGATQVSDTVTAWRWWPGAPFTLDTTAHENTQQPARPDFMRGVMLPDWWSSQNPWSPLIAPTLDWAVKDARAGWVELVGVAEITSLAPPTFSRAGAISIPDEELVKLCGEAHARGLKVFFNPGEVSFLPDSPPRPAGEAWWRAYAAQWRAVLLRWAALAEANGVEMLGFRMWPNFSDVDPTEHAFVDLLASELLAEVRAVYTGAVAVDWSPGASMSVFGKADYLNFFIWDGNLTTSFDPAVADLRAAVGARLDELDTAAAVYDRPVVLGQYTARSFDGAAGAAFVGNPNIGESDFSAFQPGDPSLVVDLQEQADVLEAMLHEIADRTWIAGAFNFGAFYWHSVDKDLNIRGKPAETVVAKWHRWLDTGRVTVSVGAGAGGSTDPAPGEYIGAVGGPFSVTATPSAGYAFAAWTGCGDEQSTTCAVTLAGDAAISAAFTPLVHGVTAAVAAGSGTFACDNLSPPHGTAVTCTATPAAGFFLSALTDNGADVLGSTAGVWVKTYAIAAVTGGHSLLATFAPSAPRVRETFAGLGKWTKHLGAWTLGGGAVSSGAATDALLVYGAPPQLKLLQAGTLLLDVKLGGTAATANAALLFSYLGKTKYRYVRLQPGKVIVGQVGVVGGAPQPAGTVKATATYAAKLNTWYQLRLDLGTDGSVGVSIRPRGATVWKKLAFSGGFRKFPTAVAGGAGLGTLRALSWFDNFSVWDPGQPPK